MPFEPVFDAATLNEPLDDRVMAGFGGVAEYGITVRWDKNFLKVIRLLLERRDRFALFGGVRFGGTLDAEGAFALRLRSRRGRRGRGQADGARAAERARDRRAHGVRLPDGAAAHRRGEGEFRRQHAAAAAGGRRRRRADRDRHGDRGARVLPGAGREVPVALRGARRGAGARRRSRRAWTAEERAIAEEFLAHARAIRGERAAAAREGRAARIVELLQAWGGATIAYRRRLIDSPSYTLNHEEVEKALEEGIRFAEGLTPLAVEVDAHGHACALRVSQHHNDGDGVWHEFGTTSLPARAILVAAGTQPNTVLAREDARALPSRRQVFPAAGRGRASRCTPVKGLAKPEQPAVLTGIRADGRATSFFGDLHPSFHGNVVKAMASAKQGYPIVSRMLGRVAPATSETDAAFFGRLNDELRATVVRVERLTPTIVEVVVRAPAAARRFEPGQFYRLQNFEALAPRRRRHAPRDGRAGADRRVGRSRAGSRLDDRAGDGRLVGSLRAARSPASRWC